MTKKTKIIIVITIFVSIIIAVIFTINHFKNNMVQNSVEVLDDNNNSFEKLDNYYFKMRKNILFFLLILPLVVNAYDVEIDGIYYNLNTELYLCSDNECYTINEVLSNNMVSLDNILKKSLDSHFAYDGGSGIYYYDDFNIVVCHKMLTRDIDKYNENIYIGSKKLNDVDICK